MIDKAKLNTPEKIAQFIADALETGDQATVASAFGIAAKTKGMSELSKQTGLSREQLYRSFSSKGNPTLKTMLAVMSVFGVKLSAKTNDTSSS
ncbi:TPA: addiction module antidote protein [Vibrio parahaemolyticus]